MAESTFSYHNQSLRIFHDLLDGNELPSDAILGFGGATNSLLTMLPNNKISTAWDLGCGSGAISLAISKQAKKVVATDISKRAIEYAKQSAEANQITNIEFRLGSLFEPVQNEKFNLIVSNPPFVIGNVTDFEHRESPFEADGLTRALFQGIPNHLNENGLAIFLTAWLETEEETWQERIEQMFPEDVHVWVGLRELQTVNEYVETWMADAKIADETAKAKWISKLKDWKTRHIAFGFVFIQRDMSADVCHNLNDVRNAIRLPEGQEVVDAIEQMKLAESLSAVDIISTNFAAATLQSWRGDVALDGVLSGLRANLGSGKGFDEAVSLVAAELNLDPDDVRVYGLVGVKTLISMGLLALNTPRI